MLYSNKLKNQRVGELLQTPRVFNFSLDYNNGVNCVSGLIDLCNKYVKSTDKVIEIGSFQGVSSRTIALHCQSLYCVDPWEWEGVLQSEEIFDSYLPYYPNIHKIKSRSVDAAKLFQNNSIDLIYIDGDHSYQSVTQDISIWINKVKKNGYISGHDNYIDDVRMAVTDYFGDNYETFSDTSWIIQVL